MNNLRICSKCKRELSLDNFHVRLRTKNKIYLQSWCKECYKIRNRTRERRTYNAKWRVDNRYDAKGLQKKRKNAQYKVRKAIKAGDLIKKPCNVCCDINVHGHHENYDKPLEVIWLCGLHHRELHSEVKKAILKELEQ